MTNNSALTTETKGMLLGLLGVAAFSLTLPLTRLAVTVLDPVFVGMGRAFVAAILASFYLHFGKHRVPTKQEFKVLVVIALGVVVGFPLLTAYAMRHVEATHGGVLLGILPLATAVAGVIVSHERPSRAFWIMAVLGSTLVILFSLLQGGGELQVADAALFAAVVCASSCYALGARLAQKLGGLQVISWALVIAAPFVAIPTIIYAPATLDFAPGIWASFIYVSVISQFLGFLPWYKGLALGGIARVGQTQLLQPFFTLAASALLLGEIVDGMTVAFAAAVCVVVAVGRNLNVAKPIARSQAGEM
jgi:drug/metabolite transporter (DMT)-like permease